MLFASSQKTNVLSVVPTRWRRKNRKPSRISLSVALLVSSAVTSMFRKWQSLVIDLS